jgi:hypothetical protein
MTDLTNITALQPYTAKQLVSFKLSAADFDQLDARLTADRTRVVVFHKATGENLSTPMTVDEGDQFYCATARALPAERCTKHQPYRHGRRRTWDGFSPCRCATVFLNHLLLSLAEARATENTARAEEVARQRAQLLVDLAQTLQEARAS